MTPKAKEKILKLIERDGFDGVLDSLQLKAYDLVEKFDLEINNPDMCWTLIYDLYKDNKLPSQYKEFTIELDNDGFLGWEDVSTNTLFYATPFWDAESNLPINIVTHKEYDERDLPDELRYIYIQIPYEFNNLEEFITWLRDFYYPTTYKVIKDITNRIDQV
jgi:hypothetical protein